MSPDISSVGFWLTRATLVAASVVVTSCGVVALPIRSDLPPDRMGSVVVSMAYATARPAHQYSLHIKDRRENRTRMVLYSPFNLFHAKPRDFSTAERAGNVFVEEMPEGDYEIRQFVATVLGYPAANSYGPKGDVSIKFSVERGVTTYLGEYLIDQVKGKNIFGLTVPAFFYVVITDQSARDLPVAGKIRPDLQARSVSKQIVNADEVGHPLIRNTPPTLPPASN